MNLKLLQFYTDVGVDSEGRALKDILAWEDINEWEKCHNFVQWVFPLPEPSQYNPDAPLLDEESLKIFRENRIIQSNIDRAHFFAKKFLFGKNIFWLNPKDHNHLRITRIIRFLNLVGLTDIANQVYKTATRLAASKPGTISDETLAFWLEASLPI